MRKFHLPGVDDSTFYWDDLSDPTAGGWDHLGELVSALAERGSHYFSPATLGWFGVDRIELYRRVGLIERQTTAPADSVLWRVTFFATNTEVVMSTSVPSHKAAKRVVRRYLDHGFEEVDL